VTFKEIQDAVLTERFGESERAKAKNWINYRYGRLWSTDDWAFKQITATVNLPNAAQSVPLTGFQRILGVWDSTTLPENTLMEAIRTTNFLNEKSTTASIPSGVSLIGSTLWFDRSAAGARSFTVLGEASFTPLSGDNDVPLIPQEFHMSIVSGAIAQGLREENDPTWNAMEADFQAGVDDMKKGYLVNVRGYGGAYPSWP